MSLPESPAAAASLTPAGALPLPRVQRPWSLAVFAAREGVDEVLGTLDGLAAVASRPTTFDLMINGNRSLADGLARALAGRSLPGEGHGVRVWQVALGGKAHAWNQYIHQVCPADAEVAFCADGYVRLEPQALALAERSLREAPAALAASGVPVSGRTASQLQQRAATAGTLHGNFFALAAHAVRQFRGQGFRLPLGLYGFDTVLGAVIGFGADPARNAWQPQRFLITRPDIRWHTPEKQWWRVSDVKTQFNRMLNNALRQLVRGATKHYLQRLQTPPGQLPRTTEDFVLSWAQACPGELRATLWRAPLSRVAIRRLRQPRDWSRAELPPVLIFEGP